MKLNPKYFLVTVLIFQTISCKNDDKTRKTIDKIPIEIKVARFDRDFANAKANDLPKLKADYPYLFPEQYPDSVWVAKMGDTIQRELSTEVEKVFGDFGRETDELRSFFQHVAYYFPNNKVPKVITMAAEVDYNNRLVLTDTLLLLGLQNYLGKDHHFYQGVQRYVAQGLDRHYLVSDVAGAFAKKVNRYPRNRSFLSRMIYYGKELYLKDMLLPDLTDAQKIGYTEEQLQWAMANEEQMWRYFIQNELLYSTDAKLDRRFLDPAPFSKFQLEIDSESPGRLGRYVGWQLVRVFAERNAETSLGELLTMPPDELFKEANYKPRK